MAEFRIQVIVDPAGARRGARQTERELNRVGNAADRLRGLIQQAFIFTGVTVGVRGLIELADTYNNLQNRLRTVTDGSAELARVTERLFVISQATRSSFEATAELYARVGLAVRELGVTQQQTLEFTESLNQAVILSGANAQEAGAGLIQLSQGLASGALRGDELRSVLEQLPVVADVIAEGLGVTRGELRELGSEGKISAGDVINAFAEAREELLERFGKAVPTIGQAFTVLRNGILQVFGDIANASTPVAIVIRNLGLALSVLAGADLSGSFPQQVIDRVERLAAALENLGRVALAVSIIIGVNLAQRALGAATRAMIGFTAAIAANPLGAIATILLATVALLISFSDQISVGTERLANLQDFGIAVWEAISGALATFIQFVDDNFFTVLDVFRSVMGDVEITFENVLIFAARIVDSLIGLFIGGAQAIVQAFKNIPFSLEAIFLGAFNSISALFTEFINSIVRGINIFGDFIGVGTLDEFTAPELAPTQTFQEQGRAVIEAFADGFNSSTAAEEAINGLFDRAEEIAEERLSRPDSPINLPDFGTPGTIPDLPGGGTGTSTDELDTILNQLNDLKDIQLQVNEAFRQGAVSAEEYRLIQAQLQADAAELVFGIADVDRQIRELNVSILELAIQAGQGGFADAFLLQLNRMTEGITTFSAGAGQVFGNFFESFTDGFANAIGQALVGAQSLGDALRNVASQALSQLIAGLVKLGIRFVINATLGKALATAATAAAGAQASALAAAWAPAAALASLATVGSNSAAAIAAITTTTATASALAAVPRFQNGGLFSGAGGPRDDRNLALISDGEFIVNAAATRRNLGLLEAINSGRSVPRTTGLSSTPTGGSSAPPGAVNIEVINNAPGVVVREEQVSENRIRLIAEEVVEENSDEVIGRAIENPNSQTSAALQRNTNTGRRN